MTEPDKVRLFTGVSVPRAALEAVDAQLDALKAELPTARWVPLDNQHVTLKFLGWTPRDRVDAVERALEIVAAGRRGSRVRLADLGAFPSARRARVLWVGIDDGERLLEGLAEDLDRALEPLGYASEARPYTPHLTLARFKTPVRIALPEKTLDPPPAFAVDAVTLYRSRLHPSGARYDALRAFTLAR